ncbi:Nose resistant to fluoxetine protein 6 [Pseudolycoriella hygida]|uniref:Nose resistant to fluoxetine protein 6 n=1 Tax=Pseudolycoriella hygida TaxID=35572 RepID=A0A9Q0MVK0_9DIPT|nr:Nose resistant to fluoxetine protein 6 [Pseudolycoriella hygida]
MNKFFLCLVSLQLTFGVSDSRDEPHIGISKILNIFKTNGTELIDILQLDLFANQGQNDTLCVQQVSAILFGLRNSEMWAVKIVDAWGKIPFGLFTGNLYELGQFDECLSVKKPKADGENDLQVQYCLADIHADAITDYVKVSDKSTLKENMEFHVGICIPTSCSPETVTRVLNYALASYNINASGLVSKESCQTNAEKEFKRLDIYTMSFLSFIALLMVASTIYDLVTTQTKRKKFLALTAFSMYRNGRQIFRCEKTKSNDVIDCLNGIRALSIIWVVFAYTAMVVIYAPILNASYYVEWYTHVFSMVHLGGTLAVDTFLVLSGLLVTCGSLRALDKSNGKLNVVMLYFHRYLRLTPSLAVAVLLSSSLMRHFGSGPIWGATTTIFEKPCQTYWWSTLLYIQNYFNPSEMCVRHSWYLAADMQLFVLSPIIVYPLWRWRLKFVWIIPLLTTLSAAYVFMIVMNNNYPTQMLERITHKNIKAEVYYPAHTRIRSWLVGVLLGYILHNLRRKSIQMSKNFVAIAWFLAIGTILSAVFGIYFMQQPDYPTTTVESALYESVSRVGWAISVSWIIFACVHGYGGPVDKVLSLPQWQPIARLAYSIYVVHSLVLQLIISSTRTPRDFSDFLMLHSFWGNFGKPFLLFHLKPK